MPKKFDAELQKLKDKLRTMGQLAQEMFQEAIAALADRDGEKIRRVHATEERVDELQVEIDRDVIRMVATFGPVAMDLRFVLMVARINTEIERIGDQSVNMCEDVELLLSDPPAGDLTNIPEMAEITGHMVRESLEAFLEGSTDKALQVIRTDDQVDALDNRVFRELLSEMMADAAHVKRAVALLLIARSLERIADHATNIAEEVFYMVKGEDIRHQE